MYRLKGFPNKSGYILVETLVSVAILSIGLVMVLGALSQGINALRASKNYTQAILLAEEKICEISRLNEVDITVWSGRSGDFGEGFPRKNFRWRVNTEELNELKKELGEVQIVEVNVLVIWQELGIDRKVNLSTYLRRKID